MKKTEAIDVASVAARLREAKVDNAERLADFAVRSWRIVATRSALDALAIGESRFGGVPDVPGDFVWPTHDGRRLSFLAQLDLAGVASSDLPPTGWLVFFYDAEQQPWGFDPKDAGGARVFYVDAPRDTLVRRSQLSTDDGGFQPCSLSLSAVIDLPDLWDSVVAHAELDDDQEEAYLAARNDLAGMPESPADEDILYHHLLGHPQLVQDDMRGECELASNGIYCGDPGAYQGERAKELLSRAAAEWQLLLQLDSDEDGPGWMWGDTGRVYFWIRRADLIARGFDRAWLVLQCG
jgi:uncharacterized protein YwqG